MKRFLPAAVLALAIHGLLFWADPPWIHPTLSLPQGREVSIDLVAIEKTMGPPASPKPRVLDDKPQPKRKPKPNPQPEPAVERAVPPAAATNPVQQPPLSPRLRDAAVPEPDGDAGPAGIASVSEDGRQTTAEDPENDAAAVRASVPLYDLNPPPDYPRAARRRNYQGTVVLDVRVTVDGLAAEVRVGQSSGYTLLDRSALRAVKAWRFSPARRGDRPVEMWVRVPVRFALR